MLVISRRNEASYFEASHRSRPRTASRGWGRRVFTRSTQGLKVKVGTLVETAGMCKYSQRELVPGEHEHSATGWAAPREKMLETRKTVLEALVKQWVQI